MTWLDDGKSPGLVVVQSYGTWIFDVDQTTPAIQFCRDEAKLKNELVQRHMRRPNNGQWQFRNDTRFAVGSL